MNPYSYRKVKDKSNRRVRGLWLRNGRYYVQCTRLDPTSGFRKLTKILLPDADSLERAKEDAVKVASLAYNGELASGEGGPTFKDFREHYEQNNHKAPRTKFNENHFLEQWQKFLGADFKIRKINTQNVLAYREALLDKKRSPRTANLHLKALKQMLMLAKTEGHVTKLATDGIKSIKVKQKEQPLMEEAELIAFGTEALRNHHKTGVQFAYYMSFLMYSGARALEALKLEWNDIDWDQDQVVFRGEISKGEGRRLDMSKNLKNVLKLMDATKDEKCKWLFPSIRSDGHVKSFKVIMEQIREDIGLPWFHLHLTRHYFISHAVMKGVELLTLSKWVGHVDTILISRVYGHLAHEHRKVQASKL